MSGVPADLPEPTTVWMFRKGTGPEGVEGTLSMVASALLFEGEGDVVVRVPFKNIRKVRTLKRAAVLEVVHLANMVSERVGFFFAPPPPVGTEGDADTAVRPRRAKRKERIGAILSFRQGKLEADDVLRQWSEALGSMLGR